ncbi:hypothetical protein [Kocuria rosea]|uniref:hypothetical protein n=1 Tax=Kocuria rosea TaxID=1275 RepID=UPI0016438BBD|nr:hypothetical protein [Kocuria rosea]
MALICTVCGTDKDVSRWSVDLDLPTMQTCQVCSFLLLNPDHAEELGWTPENAKGSGT